MDRTNTYKMANNQSHIKRVRLENCSIQILLHEHAYIIIIIIIIIIIWLHKIIAKFNKSYKNEGRSILLSTAKTAKWFDDMWNTFQPKLYEYE